MYQLLFLATALSLAVGAHAEELWHTRLFLPGSDTWHARIPVDLTNATGDELAGYPVALPVGDGKDEVNLLGAQARGIRVCNAAGVELLFDLRDANGVRLEDGPVPAGSTLTVPLTAPASGTQLLFVYFDNPDTYLVPDYLPGQAEAANGGFESGTGNLPAGWRFDAVDDQHLLTWTDERPHGGKRCVKATAAAGAPATWVTAGQRGLAVLPNRRYRLTVWVRGQDVAGKVGGYTHVATTDEPLKLNTVQSAGEGTFDWRQLTVDFTTPPDAVSLDHGTVLYGTGTAWFDDCRLECLDGAAAVTAQVGPLERLDLSTREGDKAYLQAEGHTWECRAPAVFVNVGNALTRVLMGVSVQRLRPLFQRGFNPKSLRVVDPATKQVLPHLLLGARLLFVADVPGRCRKTFQLCFSRDSQIPAGKTLTFQELVGNPGNLAKNPSFESGGAQPADWVPMAEQQPEPTARMERIEGGRIGSHCARLTVAPDAPQHWTGWSQTVQVEPNADYLFQAYARTEGITDGNVRLHAHLLEGEGSNPKKQFWSAGPDLTGTTDWTLLGGALRTSPETKKVTLYPTMNARGTVYHDGVVFMRAETAALGEVEEQEAANPSPSLRVWTEDPLVKVFHDTPPPATPNRARKQAAPVALFAARNEEECLQLCLRSTQATRVRLLVDAPQRNGAKLPAPRVEQVGYVPVLQPSNFSLSDAQPWARRVSNAPSMTDGWLGWWPASDLLIRVGSILGPFAHLRFESASV